MVTDLAERPGRNLTHFGVFVVQTLHDGIDGFGSVELSEAMHDLPPDAPFGVGECGNQRAHAAAILHAAEAPRRHLTNPW